MLDMASSFSSRVFNVFFSVSGAAGLLDKKYCKITHILTRQISAVYICTIKMCDVAFFKGEGVREEENYRKFLYSTVIELIENIRIQKIAFILYSPSFRSILYCAATSMQIICKFSHTRVTIFFSDTFTTIY